MRESLGEFDFSDHISADDFGKLSSEQQQAYWDKQRKFAEYHNSRVNELKPYLDQLAAQEELYREAGEEHAADEIRNKRVSFLQEKQGYEEGRIKQILKYMAGKVEHMVEGNYAEPIGTPSFDQRDLEMLGKYLGKTIYFSKPEKKNEAGAFILEVREIGDNVLLLTSNGIAMLRSREWLEADKSRSTEEK